MPENAPPGERQLTISAAAALTGVSNHTLRKWESRHGIVVPERTETGRRFYSESQVNQLKLIKQLLEHGHSLSHLADLNEVQLTELATKHDAAPSLGAVNSLVLVGPNVCRQLTDWGDRNVTTHAMDGYRWLDAQPGIAETSAERAALVIEVNTLPPERCQQLAQLRQTDFSRIVVIARMTSRRTRRQLRLQGIVAIDSLIPEPALLALLDQPTRANPGAPAQDQRFSSMQLAAVAAMNPSLVCECPNHIAQLLIDITAFEKYCGECEDTDPAEQSLHAYLGELTAQARGLFETALIAVAEADDLDLDELTAAHTAQ